MLRTLLDPGLVVRQRAEDRGNIIPLTRAQHSRNLAAISHLHSHNMQSISLLHSRNLTNISGTSNLRCTFQAVDELWLIFRPH